MLPIITIKQFFNDLRRQKLRSALTMFGVFWGTCSIVLLFAFGQGMQESQLKSQKGIGDNIAIVWGGITSKEFKGLPTGRRVRATENDILMIKKTARTIGKISPEYNRRATVKYGKEVSSRTMIGVWPEFGDIRNIIPEIGSRFINQRDMDEKRRVIFIGDRLATDLFGDSTAVGQRILINGTPFTVVGVMKTKQQDSSYNGRDSRKAFIPASTFQSMFSRRFVSNFVLQSGPEFTMAQSTRELYEILGAKYRFDPTDREALSIWDTTEGFEFLRNFFMAFKWFLVGIGISTLITGGIGVSNIMNVVLEERTKEIGIKMALGARKSMILSQFVFETMMITAVGGIAGFLFATGIVMLIPQAGLEEFIGVPTVNMMTGLLITGLLGIIGLLAGIFPARRAANLQPVQALKLF